MLLWTIMSSWNLLEMSPSTRCYMPGAAVRTCPGRWCMCKWQWWTICSAFWKRFNGATFSKQNWKHQNRFLWQLWPSSLVVLPSQNIFLGQLNNHHPWWLFILLGDIMLAVDPTFHYKCSLRLGSATKKSGSAMALALASGCPGWWSSGTTKRGSIWIWLAKSSISCLI